MTIESDTLDHNVELIDWRGRLARLNAAVFIPAADILAAMAAAALPWSTTAPAVLIALWLLVLVPTIDWKAYARHLEYPVCALPLGFVLLAVIGTHWSNDAWSVSLHGIKPVLKLLLIPALLYHFQRSQAGLRALVAFLASCTLLMALSWIVLFVPGLKISATVSDGVPVKNYIDQSQEFTLCAFALAMPAVMALRQRQWASGAGYIALIFAFVANMMFVASARTALVCMLVLLALFAWLHLSRRATLALVVAVTVAAVLTWSTSSYLRKRITDISAEYHATDTSGPASTAQRLTYWQKSIGFIADAPLFGHGTGSIKRLFTRDAIGQTGLKAEVVGNPHNQTLAVAIQWGAVGVILLYAMWCSHLLLFTGEGLAAWIGLAVVMQNIVSSLLNSHLFDFHEGWMYVLGVGITGGMAIRERLRTPAIRRDEGSA